MTQSEINNIAFFWIVIAVVALMVLLFIKAPYGRYAPKNIHNSIDNKMGWVFMELPSFLIMLVCLVAGNTSAFTLFLGVLWLLHYLNRSLIFPFRLKTKGKRMPLSIMISGIVFNMVNAGLNGYCLGFFADKMSTSFFEWNFILGIVVFSIGALINIFSDNVLLSLRKGEEGGYKIPYGSMFNYLSCPNMFGEIIEWTGFAILAWNLPALSFALWTFANLVPRAIVHHQWYKKEFHDYPTGRKAIIPFIL